MIWGKWSKRGQCPGRRGEPVTCRSDRRSGSGSGCSGKRTGAGLAVALLAAGLHAAPAAAEPVAYVIDETHLSVGFLVRHLGFQDQLGMFLEGGGSFKYDATAEQVEDLRVEIDADSVFTNHEARDEHLRGADFLNVSAFPKIVFTGDRVEKTGDNTGVLHGELELLGQKQPLSLDVTLNKAGVYPFGHKKETLGISARGSFKRSAFGMDYLVGPDGLGDDVALILEFEAIRQ